MYRNLSFYRTGALAFSAVVGFSFLTTAASAQTVTVDASLGSPDNTTTFNLLSTAVASFANGGANAGDPAANIINIATGTPVVDKVNADLEFTSPMVIEGDLTIQGDGGLATFAGQPLSNTEQLLRVTTIPVLPCFTWRQAGTLTLKNIAFIPTDPTMLSLVLVKSPTSSADAIVNVENCVFTSNNGSNQPIVTTGQEAAPDLGAAGVITLGDDGDAFWGFSRVEQGDLTLNFTNTVFASFSGDATDNDSDGIIAYMNGTTSDLINCFINVNEGCVFANVDGRCIQNPYGGLVNVNGTAANPVIFREVGGNTAIYNLSDTSGDTQPVACKVNYARFFNLAGNAIAENNNARGFIDSVTNTIIANAGSDGLAIRSGGALPPNGEATDTITVDNVVIHNAGSGAVPGGIYTSATSNRNMNISNSVFTGAGKNGIVNNGTGVYTVTNSTLSLNGDNALAAATAGTGTINLDPSVDNVEVTYVNMTDPFSPDFFKVAGSSVNDWSVY